MVYEASFSIDATLFVGIAFHFIYRSAISVCLTIENKAVAYYAIFVLSVTAERNVEFQQ